MFVILFTILSIFMYLYIYFYYFIFFIFNLLFVYFLFFLSVFINLFYLFVCLYLSIYWIICVLVMNGHKYCVYISIFIYLYLLYKHNQSVMETLFPENDWFFHEIVLSPASRDSSCRRIKRVVSQWKSKPASVCTSVSHDKWERPPLMFLRLSAAYSACSRLTGSAWRRRWRAAIFQPAGWAYVRLIAPESRWQTGRPHVSTGSQFLGFTKIVCFRIEARRLTNDSFHFQNQKEFVCLPYHFMAIVKVEHWTQWFSQNT